MIASDVIEEVRRLVDAVAVIGARVQVRKSGASYVGCCPFHDEREGSFRVYPDEKRFVCYGCGARGDVFEFFQRLEGKPFPAVVRELAEAVGVAVPQAPLSPAEARIKGEQASLLAACEEAAGHWQKRLLASEGEAARRYIAGRGIRPAIVQSFRLGYALPEWHDLERALAGLKIDHALQHAAGLVASKEESGKPPRYYDRFRDRLMFPIEDARGRVVGFGGRAIGSERGAKYLNGPETLLYKKSRVLYGIRQARETIRRSGRAILVEGYFDVLSLHQVGLVEAVATCGTTLAVPQVELLGASGCRDLVLLFDGDEAGQSATARVAPVLLQASFNTTVARIPPVAKGKNDPHALTVQSGKAGVDAVLAEGRTLTEFLIEEEIRKHAGGLGAQAPVERKLKVVRELMPLVLAAPEGLARSIFERTLASKLDVDIGPLRREVRLAAVRTRALGNG